MICMPYGEANVRPAVLQDAPAIAQVHVESARTTYKGIFSDRLLARLSVEDRARSWSDTLTAPEPKLITLVGCNDAGKIVSFVCGARKG